MRVAYLVGLCLTVGLASTLAGCGANDDGSATGDNATSALSSSDADANQLILYAIPAPSSLLNEAGLSWKTPGGLVRRVLVNEAGGKLLGFTRTIGHAGVRVQCAATSDKPAAHFQGSMTENDPADFDALVLKKEVGLGMLFDNVPGKIEPEAALQATIDANEPTGKIAFIRFQISPETCQGLLGYAAAYQADDVQKNYGLAARPLYKEGAGCSAFSMSFLQLANLVEPRFHDGWSFDVRVPLYTDPLFGLFPEPLIGGSLHPENEVPITRLIGLTRGWATPEEQGTDLFGWDPTMMYDWLQTTTAQALHDGSETVETVGQARGLVLDRRDVAPSAALADGTYFAVP